MSKNPDRDIVILEARSTSTKDKTSNNDSRKNSGNDLRNDRSDLRGSRSKSKDRGRNERSSHRDRVNDRISHDYRGNSGAGNVSKITKFSGMAFTDIELLSEIPKKKFTGRCRLFVGNLPNEVKEAELKELFTPHGEISECYLSGKGFAFLRLDTRAHAESAKEALDGKTVKGRQIRVRFAVHGATIKVKELSSVVSNEMLNLTFAAFGEIERAVHIVDEKGKPTGEGIIEFERKTSALDALTQIKERVFLLTANSRPLIAEMVEPRDEEDGLSERMLQRTAQLLKERELGPRFAALNSFEYVYGQRWKELYEIERKRRHDLEQELKEARKRLDADMEIAYEDYKTQLLREDLQRRQQELERLEAAKRERMRQASSSGGGLFCGIASQDPTLIDGPLGRNNSPAFGAQRSNNAFFGGAGLHGGLPGGPMNGPVSNSSTHRGLPPPICPGSRGPPLNADSKVTDVHKLLQKFKGENCGPRPLSQSLFGGSINGNNLNDRHAQNYGCPPPNNSGSGNLPNHLLNIMKPFANALTGNVPGGINHNGPPHLPGAMPPPNLMSDQFPPPEKKFRH